MEFLESIKLLKEFESVLIKIFCFNFFKYEFYIIYLHTKLEDMKQHLLKSNLLSPAGFHPTNLSGSPSCTWNTAIAFPYKA